MADKPRNEDPAAQAEAAGSAFTPTPPPIPRVLVGIRSGSGIPIFSDGLSDAQAENIIDSFVSQRSEITDESVTGSLFKFSDDILIFKLSVDKPSSAADAASSVPSSPYYSFYEKGSKASTEANLQYNYNMTIQSVETEFSILLNKITDQLVPPKTSRTFAYDFKFSQNQNPSITTGSVRPVRTRTARSSGGSSGGGGY